MLRELGFIKLSKERSVLKSIPKSMAMKPPKPIFSKDGLNIKVVKSPSFSSKITELADKVEGYKKYTKLLQSKFTPVYQNKNTKIDIKIPIKDLKKGTYGIRYTRNL